MNDNYPTSQPFHAGPAHGTHGAAAEIESILERVRDERLRLLRLLKDCESRFGTSGVVPPAEEVARLTGKVRAIDDAVKNRYTQLRHDETLVEKRAYQVDQLRECVQGLADQVNSQIELAKNIEPNISAVRRAAQNETDQVLRNARAQLDQLNESMNDRLSEYRHAQTLGHEQLRETRREIEQAFKDIDDRLASAAGRARDEAQKLIDPIFGQLENHATECGNRVRQIVESTDEIVQHKLEALPAQAQKALEPARETLDSVIEDARAQVASVNDTLGSLSGRMQEMSDKAEGLIQHQLDAVTQRAERILQGQFDQKLQEHLATLDARITEALDARRDALITQLNDRAAAQADELLARQQQQIEHTVNERVQRAADEMTRRFEALITDANNRAETSAQQIKDRLAASIDQTRAEAARAADETEAQARAIEERVQGSMQRQLNNLTESMDRIEMRAAEINDKAERQARKVGEIIESNMREQVVSAMSRAEAITEPFKARLSEALAEHQKLSDDCSKAAEAELSAKAKAHWDAFRNDTKAALDKQKQALEVEAQSTIEETQQAMRQRIQEMCASSQSMVDLIEQQLTRRLKGMEPQTHQAIETLEKQFNERISRLRENAQSMVALAEDQLSKRVAELQPKAVNAARDAERELNEHLDRVREEVENVVAPLRRQVIEELSQIADLGKSIRGAVRREQGAEAGSTEPPVIDTRKLASPLQEMASRMGRKAARLVGARNEAEETAESAEASDNPDTERKAA